MVPADTWFPPAKNSARIYEKLLRLTELTILNDDHMCLIYRILFAD